MMLLSLAFGQTNTEPVQIPNTSYQWCMENARVKDELVRHPSSDCTWATATDGGFLPTNTNKIYKCDKWAISGRPPGYRPGLPGYEGQLICKNPFTGVADVVYLCAVCLTSDSTSGKVDADCQKSMKTIEEGYCGTNVAEFDYRHEIGGLVQIKPGLPVPNVFPFKDTGVGAPP